MNWSEGLSWLAALGKRRHPPARDTDCADMGTAFGLDASLGAPSVSEASHAAGPATQPAAHWKDRLDRRSGL